MILCLVFMELSDEMPAQTKASEGCLFLWVSAGVLLTISLCGQADWSLAIDQQVPHCVKSERMAGKLNQVPLSTVLRPLHEQLLIVLSKIRARCDYAFTWDAAGNITILHGMAKVSFEVSWVDTVGSKKVKIHKQKPRPHN